MRGEPNQRAAGEGASRALLIAPVLAVVLAGCGSGALSSSSLSSLNIFDSNKATTTSAAAATPESSDIECPGVTVRSGASTLMIGDNSKNADPGALSLRYQGTIIRTARECNVSAGVMTMKVGVEGRIITGPAGGPGNVDVPLRIAVVHEGVNPKPITSKFTRIPVTVTSDNDRVGFTHVESNISFPMPVPAGAIDSYVVYVGFDTLTAPEKKPPPARRKPAAKPKQS
ncbi:MAG: hypothetical protein Q8M24_15790 [Pseudolabrys sp.]|nr:hypothetical protein [Pseudolabrys sp.]MDP2296905.1 hypothetical protein [Pseudolabrys sp.]